MTVRPFHCGTQSADWADANCARCARGWTEGAAEIKCDIEEALFEAYWDYGEVSDEIAERMGYTENNPPKTGGFAYVWPCPERVKGEDRNATKTKPT